MGSRTTACGADGDAGKLHFFGVRGTRPVCAPECQRVGGHTTCLVLPLPEAVVVLDAGSGLAAASRYIEGFHPSKPLHILLTHGHLDHLMGLPFLSRWVRGGPQTHVYLPPEAGGFSEEVFWSFFEPPFSPIGRERVRCRPLFHPCPAGGHRMRFSGGWVVGTWPASWHPGGIGLAGVLRHDEPRCLMATDVEAPDWDGEAWGAWRGVRHLLHDAQYDEIRWQEQALGGYGHSTPSMARRSAEVLEAGHLWYFHHDPDRTDMELDTWKDPGGSIPVDVARQGMVLDLC